MIMGGVYLTYSAYFLSIDFIYIYYTMNAVMVCLYFGLAYTYGKNCYENIKTCNSYINEMVDGEPNIMGESLILKRKMLKWISVGSVGFCLTKVLLYGVINNMMDDYVSYKLELLPQGFDFIWVSIILIACRPRKIWPPYFTLSVHEMRSAEGRGGNNNGDDGHAPAPLLVGQINQTLLEQNHEKDRCDSIGTNDAILFLNPVEYTVDLDNTDYIDNQMSAFEAEGLDVVQPKRIDINDIDENHVFCGITLGCKEKRQQRRIRKQEEKETNNQGAPRPSVVQRMFSKKQQAKVD